MRLEPGNGLLISTRSGASHTDSRGRCSGSMADRRRLLPAGVSRAPLRGTGRSSPPCQEPNSTRCPTCAIFSTRPVLIHGSHLEIFFTTSVWVLKHLEQLVAHLGIVCLLPRPSFKECPGIKVNMSPFGEVFSYRELRCTHGFHYLSQAVMHTEQTTLLRNPLLQATRGISQSISLVSIAFSLSRS